LFGVQRRRAGTTIGEQAGGLLAPEAAMAQTESTPALPTSPATAASVLAMPIMAMARFRRLMNYEGWDVDLPRMCVDTAYAYRCLATAHTSSDERLRQAAMNLFQAYDRNVAVPMVH
jgi:hypothetical protein